MLEWWAGLSSLNQTFYIAAGFLSLIAVWQFLSSLMGMSGGADDFEVAHPNVDIDFDGGMDLDDIEAHSIEEAGESIAAFKFLSLRAILAFCTLFAWAAALYLDVGRSLTLSLLYAFGWGLAGWVVVILLVNLMRRLAETGTRKLVTCVGRPGTVYMNIPAGGEGEVRTLVSGVVTMVKARNADGSALPAGMAVRVRRLLDHTTVEVAKREDSERDKDGQAQPKPS